MCPIEELLVSFGKVDFAESKAHDFPTRKKKSCPEELVSIHNFKNQWL